MTTAEMIKARGKTLGRAEALIQVLTVRFGPLPESVSQRVHEASLAQVEKWTARAVTVESLDEVFT